MKNYILFVVGIMACPVAAQNHAITRQEKAAMALTAEEVAEKMETTGRDPLDPSLWVSSKPFLRGAASDRFLRANINKVTGEVFYQLYMTTTSRSDERLTRMTYLAGGAVKTAAIERIGIDVDCFRSGCSYYQDFVAEIPRSDLEELSRRCPSWTARFFGETPEGSNAEFLCNETAGFLLAVDRQISLLDK